MKSRYVKIIYPEDTVVFHNVTNYIPTQVGVVFQSNGRTITVHPISCSFIESGEIDVGKENKETVKEAEGIIRWE